MARHKAHWAGRFLQWLSGGRPLGRGRPPWIGEFALVHHPLTTDGAHIIAADLALGAVSPGGSRAITDAGIRERLEQVTLADADPADVARVRAILRESGFHPESPATSSATR